MDRVYRDSVEVGTAVDTTFVDTTVLPATTYSYEVAAVDSAGNESAWSTPAVVTTAAPIVGLVAHWKLDEVSGSTAADASGNGHTASLLNGSGWTAGQVGGAVTLDGIDDFVEVAASGPLSTATTTWATWVRTPSPTTSYQMLMTLGKDVRELRFNNTTGRVQTNWLIGGVKRKATSPTGLSADTWYHVAATYDGSQVVLYVDGTEAAVVAASGSGSRHR